MAVASATIEKFIESPNGFMEVVRLECSDGELYKSRKFKWVQAAFVCWNEDNEDKYVNVVNEDGTEIDGTSQTVAINNHALTDKTMTLLLFGKRS